MKRKLKGKNARSGYLSAMGYDHDGLPFSQKLPPLAGAGYHMRGVSGDMLQRIRDTVKQITRYNSTAIEYT